MDIFIALISILIITGLTLLFNRFSTFKICSVCVGVSGTWIWMLAAVGAGYQVNLLVPAMLIGGSVVGIAYQIDKKVKFRWPITWKTLFIVFGFWVAYSLIIQQWVIALASGLCLLIFTYLFSVILPKEQKTASELEKKMDDCC